jgi:5-(carboxyamino)imidazole ribonucleotide synthase
MKAPQQQRIGILGGGQLGRMLVQAGQRLNLDLAILDPDTDAPAAKLGARFVCGSFRDYDTVLAFGRTVDKLTVEIENVSVEALAQLEKEGVFVYPRASTLQIIRDKGIQKQFMEATKLPTAPYQLAENLAEAKQLIRSFPVVQKVRGGGYDGFGVRVHHTAEDILTRGLQGSSVWEDFVPLAAEVAVIVARSSTGEVKTFPPVGMTFHPEANQVELLYLPANLSDALAEEAKALACKATIALDLVGLLAVEFFLTKDGKWLVNEMAPRPHNSGHLTIEACQISQFEQHMRAILGLPLGDTSLRTPAAMANLVGAPGYEGIAVYRGLEEALSISGVHLHLYGKSQTRPFRKMGHATTTANTVEEALANAQEVKQLLRIES